MPVLTHAVVLALSAVPQVEAPASRPDELEKSLRAHEAVLAKAGGGASYEYALVQAVKQVEAAHGAEAVVGWVRKLHQWHPRQAAHIRTLILALDRAGKTEEAARLAIETGNRWAEKLGLVFDESGRVLWDHEAGRRGALGIQATDVVSSWKLAVDLGAKGAESELARRVAALEPVLWSKDFSNVVNSLIEVSDESTFVELVRGLRSRHPGDRRRAAEECSRRIAKGRVDQLSLREMAEAALEAQGVWPWHPKSGVIVEAAWNQGLLNQKQRQRYAERMVESSLVLISQAPRRKDPTKSDVSAIIMLPLRASLGPSNRSHSPREVEVTVWLEPSLVAVDRRRVEFESDDVDERGWLRLDPVYEHVQLERVHWDVTPGRHLLEVHGDVRIECRGKKWGGKVEVSKPLFLRGAFFGW